VSHIQWAEVFMQGEVQVGLIGVNRNTGRMVEARLLLSFLLALAGLSAGMLVWQSISPHPYRVLGLSIDRLSAVLTLLVGSVGAVTLRFSLRYLDGEPRRPRFLRLLAVTVTAAYLLMLATNLLVLFAAWSVMSAGLHGLLTFYPERPEAGPPARKKLVISRIGDVALIAAIVLVWQGWGTFDLHDFLDAIVLGTGNTNATAVALLIVAAALTKSAQFPFHSWLPETMECPTAVSALMHAGVINAGGALILRFAPLVVRVPEALFLLAVVGTLTVVLGLLAMWAQTKVKRTLAWSTVSQMGFMMIQCGLGAFPAAAVHIIGHGCYKAWSFLRSGELPAAGESTAAARPRRALTLATIGTILAIPALVLAATLTGFSPQNSPGELALSAVVALSVGQVWVALLGVPRANSQQSLVSIASAIGLTVAAPLTAFALYQGAGLFLAPVLGDLPVSTGPLAWAAAVIPVTALIVLIVVQALLPILGRTRLGRAFYVHSLHGFYLGALADRAIAGLWNRFQSTIKGVKHA